MTFQYVQYIGTRTRNTYLLRTSIIDFNSTTELITRGHRPNAVDVFIRVSNIDDGFKAESIVIP